MRAAGVIGLAAFIGSARIARAGADNVVQIENAKPGTTAWQLTNRIVNREIEGYASLTSVNRGGQISFFVNTVEASYTLEVFRTGWYGGAGGRRMTSAVTRTGVSQVTPQPDSTTGLIECNWTDPYTLTIPAPSDPNDPAYWASGIYLVKLTSGTSGHQAYIVFVVRDDARASDYLFQSSVTTYQAYNDWGGLSLYTTPRAQKVSFNRPYRENSGAGKYGPPTSQEQSMVRFLEREGYDLTYCTDVDTHENASLLFSHRGFLSVGHDEYWSWQMRANVEAARDRGVSIAFLDGNTCYWQIRFETSALTGSPDRTIVCYRSRTTDPIMTDGDAANDYLVTIRWRDSPLNKWEDALLGVMYGVEQVDAAFVVEDDRHWIYAGTGVTAGDQFPHLVGGEADRMYGHAPGNTSRFAHSPMVSVPPTELNTTFSDATAYTAVSGASVISLGSIWWSWGLDDWGVPGARTSMLNPAAQQMTHNILARFVEGGEGSSASAATVTATASPQPVVLGGTVTFDLTVGNHGSRSLTNVVLTDTLPSGFTFQSASSSAGACSSSTGNVTCMLGQLNVGGSAAVSIIVGVSRLGALKSGISLAADQPEATVHTAKLVRAVGAGFSPAFGSVGSFVTIYGTSLGSASAVNFNGVNASFVANSNNQITAHVPAGATTGSLSITTSSGTTAMGTFSVSPSVTGFSPPSGPAGTSVTINGSSFTGATAVQFNGTNSASFVVKSPTQITAVVPSSTSGNITVTTPGGSGRSANYFGVSSVSVTGFAPSSGPAGSSVTVTGTNFAGVTRVYVNDRTVLSYTVVSSSEINIIVPDNATSGPIRVNASGGSVYSADSFTITTPSISLFYPSAGPAGTNVFLDGGNFTGATSVKFNGMNASYAVLSPTRIVASVPAGATTGAITVATPSGTATSAAWLTQTGSFTVTLITGFTPTNGPVGTNVTITGTNLTEATAVKFNGVSAATFTVNSSTQITAMVPSGATTGAIAVSTPSGTSSTPASFSITLAPLVISFSPVSGAVGSDVVVTGTNLSGATAVTFNGNAAAFTVNSSTQITARVLAGTSTGSITVTTSFGTATSAGAFTVLSQPAIAGFSPTSGPIGTSVTITGTDLTGATAVTFGGAAALFAVNSATQITATVPSGTTTGPITVTTPAGTATSSTSFTVFETPSITSFSPTSGSIGSGVVITGTSLTGATAVQFNGVSAATFTVNSSTQVTATVPLGATTGPIAVSTPGGTATSASSFTVVGAPTITAFSPTSGTVGTNVVITGTNLTGTTAVAFNGTAATSFTVNSSTQVTAAVPSGATTGPISVTTPGGTAMSTGSFTVIAAPTITSFSPISGPIGTSVVITGTNLTGATAVEFNNISATTFTVNSSTRITATVPSGATSGPVRVTTPGGTATSAGSFSITPSPTISTVELPSGAVGDVVSIVGTDFNGVTRVTFGGVDAAAFTVNTSTQITATVPVGASSGPVGVTASDGVATSPSSFTVTPFSPVLGPAGMVVVITGSGFTGATSVTFGGVSAGYSVNSDSQITATVPPGATTGPITITSGTTYTTSAPFTVTPFSPIAGAVGTQVTIAGSGLDATSSVTFNGVAATYTINSNTQVTATVPSGATSGPVSVTTSGGTLTSATDFTVTPFSPVAGAAGSTVTIRGTGFSSATGVAFNGRSAIFTINSDAQITATVPSAATTGPLTVTLPSTSSTSASNFTVTSPAITSFSPSSGNFGAAVVITGANFRGVTTVQFNGTTAASYTIDAPIQITTVVPNASTSGPIQIRTTLETATSSSNFTVTSTTISGFSPTSGLVGTSVVITGTNLTGATGVTFNGTAATSFAVNSATQVTATVPSGATTGPISVTTPGGTATSASSFTVTAAPTITSFSPTSGSVGSGVVITGTSLTGATAVQFNGVSAATFTVNSSTQITATVPSGATSGPITVTTPVGTATSAASFTVVTGPTITSFSPTSGPVGTSVGITGTNLTGATAVTFNGARATFTVNTSTQITATVPSGATTGRIGVTTAGGTVTSANSFTVVLAPSITSISPRTGAVGSTVVISGTNLTGATAVKFNAVPATFTVNSSTQITTIVPPNAKNGPISVTTPGGTATSPTPFKVR